MVPIGRMSERITIRHKQATRDPLTGAEVPTWTTGATIWAAAEPIAGREYAELAQAEAEAEVRFTCHWNDVKDVKPDARVIWRGASHEITRPVIDLEAKRRQGVLMCRSTQNG